MNHLLCADLSPDDPVVDYCELPRGHAGRHRYRNRVWSNTEPEPSMPVISDDINAVRSAVPNENQHAHDALDRLSSLLVEAPSPEQITTEEKHYEGEVVAKWEDRVHALIKAVHDASETDEIDGVLRNEAVRAAKDQIYQLVGNCVGAEGSLFTLRNFLQSIPEASSSASIGRPVGRAIGFIKELRVRVASQHKTIARLGETEVERNSACEEITKSAELLATSGFYASKDETIVDVVRRSMAARQAMRTALLNTHASREFLKQHTGCECEASDEAAFPCRACQLFVEISRAVTYMGDDKSTAPVTVDIAARLDKCSLFLVQDTDRPMHVLALNWQDAIRVWESVVRRENNIPAGESVDPPNGVQHIASAEDIAIAGVKL